MKASKLLFIVPIAISIACTKNKEKDNFDVETVKPIIQELEKKWSRATREKNIDIVSSIYAEQSHYVPDMGTTKHGKKEITEYWKKDLPVIDDVQLTMESLEGTKEVLYETGKGYSLLKNPSKTELDTFYFKYVNVWRLQEDGSYQCVIDTYNDVPAN